MYSAVKLFMLPLLDKEFTSWLLTSLTFVWYVTGSNERRSNSNQLNGHIATYRSRGDNKLILPQHLYTGTRTVVQLCGLNKLDLTLHVNILTDK